MGKSRYQSFVDDGGLTKVYLMRMKGAQDKEICEALHISRNTFYRWLREHNDISDIYKNGREDAIADAVRALTSKFKVRTLTETTTESWNTPDGEKIHTIVKEREVPPDTTALIFYLKAQAGWRDNAEITDTTTLEKLDEILKSTQKAAEDAVLK